MKTSETARELGLYSSDCCDAEMIFDKGDTFCRCPRCERLCRWDLLENVVMAGELDEFEKQAA